MILEKIKSDGLAQLSYILGDGDEAIVIDPRRDCDVYLDIAAREGMRITHIFETHRNEDFAIGSLDLARLSGAIIHHGAAMEFAYGESTCEGDTFNVGDLQLRVLETPGHTMESISLVLTDRNFGDTPWLYLPATLCSLVMSDEPIFFRTVHARCPECYTTVFSKNSCLWVIKPLSTQHTEQARSVVTAWPHVSSPRLGMND